MHCLKNSSLESFYPKLRYVDQIRGNLSKVYKMWVYHNIPYLQDTLHVKKRNLVDLDEVKEIFRILVNARLKTLRNSFQKYKLRRKKTKNCNDNFRTSLSVKRKSISENGLETDENPIKKRRSSSDNEKEKRIEGSLNNKKKKRRSPSDSEKKKKRESSSNNVKNGRESVSKNEKQYEREISSDNEKRRESSFNNKKKKRRNSSDNEKKKKRESSSNNVKDGRESVTNKNEKELKEN